MPSGAGYAAGYAASNAIAGGTLNWDLGLERSTAGTGVIGTTSNTTAITIGRSGITTSFPGYLSQSITDTSTSGTVTPIAATLTVAPTANSTGSPQILSLTWTSSSLAFNVAGTNVAGPLLLQSTLSFDATHGITTWFSNIYSTMTVTGTHSGTLYSDYEYMTLSSGTYNATVTGTSSTIAASTGVSLAAGATAGAFALTLTGTASVATGQLGTALSGVYTVAGDSDRTHGVFGSATQTAGTGNSIGGLYGCRFQCNVQGGTVSSGYGGSSKFKPTGGTTTLGVGFRVIATEMTGGTVTWLIGHWIEHIDKSGGTLTTQYGLLMEDRAGGTNIWNLVVSAGQTYTTQAGTATAPSAISGKLRVGDIPEYNAAALIVAPFEVASATSAGAAGALGPRLSSLMTTQAATSGATIRNPGFVEFVANTWETTGGTSTVQRFGAIGAVVDTITASSGAVATYRVVVATNSGTILTSVSESGNIVATQVASTSGSPMFVTLTQAAHTTLTAGETRAVTIDLTNTVQFAAGKAIPTQRSILVQAPSFGADGAQTITTAATCNIAGAPGVGANVTITNSYGLSVGGAVSLASTAALTYAGVIVPAHTLTLSGTTQITSVGPAMLSLGILTITDSSAITVDSGSTLYIAGPPAQGGSVTLSVAYSIWVDTGDARFDGVILNSLGSVSACSYAFNGDPNTGVYSPGADILGLVAGGAEIANLQKSSSGGGWMIMDEADSNPGTSQLDASDSLAIYNKANKLVFAYNLAGTINYLSCALDGSTTTWKNESVAP